MRVYTFVVILTHLGYSKHTRTTYRQIVEARTDLEAFTLFCRSPQYQNFDYEDVSSVAFNSKTKE